MTKKLILDVDDELWEKFKATVPKTKTMNEAVVELIICEVGRSKEE